MKKTLNILAALTLVLLQFPSITSAQAVVEVDTTDVDEAIIDTLIEDTISDYSQYVTQYELKECDWVDICLNPKYAIVTKKYLLKMIMRS